MSRLLSTLGVLLLAITSSVAVAQEPTGKWIEGGLSDADGKGGRDYKLYVPARYRDTALPLVVMLHGCTQTPDVFAESTRMNALADREGFMVLYPSQALRANPARCWNWFLPDNQARDSGEPAQIVGMIGDVASRYAINAKRVYVTGLSAGASMTAVLAACYPDVFAAAAIHDGTMYKSADTVLAAGKVMATGDTPDPDALALEAWNCGGKQRLTVPVMVWHGQGDNIVHRENADKLVRQFARVNDWADDGHANGTAPQQPKTESGQVDGGHPYTVSRYTHQGRPLIEYYQVAEMGHAWSGGKDDLLFSDAKGPDASLLMWNFFKQFSR